MLRVNTAAAMLKVSPSTLRGWERRHGWPSPGRSEGGHRLYELGDIEALREALARTTDVGAAIALARERGRPVASSISLTDGLANYDPARCDRALEESLALRSLERTVAELLLSAVATLAEGSAERGFAWRYATGWLAAALRTAPPANRDEGVLLLDAAPRESLDALAVQALELCLRRRGVRTLALPATLAPDRIGHAVRAVRPSALVLCGAGAALDELGQLVWAARRAAGQLPVLDFRGALAHGAGSTVTRLPDDVLAAGVALGDGLARGLEQRRARRAS